MAGVTSHTHACMAVIPLAYHPLTFSHQKDWDL